MPQNDYKLLTADGCLGPCYQLSKVDPETGCKYKCHFQNHATETEMYNADGIVGYVRSGMRRRKGQILFAYWQESTINQKGVMDPKIMKEYNYSYSYRQDGLLKRSRLALGSFYRTMYDKLALGEFPDPLPFEFKKKHPMGSTMISSGGNTPNRRGDVLLAILRQNISSANYGNYLKNSQVNTKYPELSRFDIYTSWQLGRASSKRELEKVKAISQHLFHFAFENSDCLGYHTEKSIQSLAAGTVGVYLGHNSVKEILPENSAIIVRDFPNAKILADHLYNVSSNQSLYESYFEWRKKPMPAHLVEFTRRSTPEYLQELHCQLCTLVHNPIPSMLKPDDGCVYPVWSNRNGPLGKRTG